MKAQPAARALAVIIGILLIALGAAAGYEFWVNATHSSQPSLLKPVLDYITKTSYQTWMFIVAIIVAIIALLLIIAALKPRKTTHVAYHYGDTTLQLRKVDFARLLTVTALGYPGVRGAESTVSKRKATVRVDADYLDESLVGKLRADEESHAAALESPVSISLVRAHGREK